MARRLAELWPAALLAVASAGHSPASWDVPTMPPPPKLPATLTLVVPPVLPGVVGAAPVARESGGHKGHHEPEFVFDCKGNSKARAAWSEEREAWCCKHAGVGCPEVEEAPAADKARGQAAAQREGHGAAAAAAGSAEKRAAHTTTRRTTTRTTPTTTQTTTTTNTCDSNCVMNGVPGTCREHIQKSSLFDFLGDPDSCTLAQKVTVKSCAVCGGCPAHEAGCGVLEPTSTQPPSTTIPAGGNCAAICSLGGQDHSCIARVEWVTSSFNRVPGACQEAHQQVLNDCQVCGGCALADTGCVDAGGPVQGCAVRPHEDTTAWPQARKDWCCEHEGVACPAAVDVLHYQHFQAMRTLQFGRSRPILSVAVLSLAALAAAGFVSRMRRTSPGPELDYSLADTSSPFRASLADSHSVE